MILCIDVDNVLNNLTEETLNVYNTHMGKNIQMEDLTEYDFYKCLSKEDADCIMALFKEKDLWVSLRPIDGSQKALKQLLKNGHQVYLATATATENFPWKIKWLQHHFSFIPTDNIIRIMDKSLLKCDVLVDDSLDNLINTFAERVCLDFPWNRRWAKDEAYGIHRCKNWQDIVHTINQIDKEMKEWDKK